jgi:hypothetical protein
MKTKYFLLAIVFIVLLTLTLGVFLPHYISKQHSFVGVVAGHIYADNSSNKIISNQDLHTCYFLLTHGGGLLAAFGTMITQRISITGTSDLEARDCGVCSAKLYTFFNIKYLQGNAGRNCNA